MEENQNVNEIDTPLIEINEESSSTVTVPNSAPKKEKEQKKKGKILPIIIGVVILILAIIIGGFFYLKGQRTASKYIDTKLAEVKSSIEENYDNDTFNSIGTLDFLNEEMIADGSLKIIANGESLKPLNGLELNYKLKSAVKNEYIEANLSIKDDKSNIDGSIYLNSKDIYLDIKDVTTTPIKIESDENLFESIKSEFEDINIDEMKDLLDLNNLKDFSLKTIDFMSDSLKETISSTKQKGLNVEYTYEFNNETLVKAIDKYMELAKKDEKYTSYIKQLTNMEDINFDTKEINITDKLIVTIEVNMLSNKLQNITIVYNDKTILSKVGKDQYKLLFDKNNDKNYAILTIKDDNFNVVVFNDNTEYASLEILSKKKEGTINLEIKPLSISASINVKEISKNEIKINANADVSIAKIKLDASIKANGGKLSTNGTITIDVAAQVLGNTAESVILNYNINYEHGNNIVSKASLSNAKSINQITENDYNTMNEKLEKKIENSNILSLIRSYFEINNSDNYYDEYTFDESELDFF